MYLSSSLQIISQPFSVRNDLTVLDTKYLDVQFVFSLRRRHAVVQGTLVLNPNEREDEVGEELDLEDDNEDWY